MAWPMLALKALPWAKRIGGDLAVFWLFNKLMGGGGEAAAAGGAASASTDDMAANAMLLSTDARQQQRAGLLDMMSGDFARSSGTLGQQSAATAGLGSMSEQRVAMLRSAQAADMAWKLMMARGGAGPDEPGVAHRMQLPSI